MSKSKGSYSKDGEIFRGRMLVYMQEYYRDNGVPATIREIQHAMNIKSESTALWHVRVLVEQGKVAERKAGKVPHKYIPLG